MPRRRALPLLILLVCAGATPSHAAAPGEIVFSTDRGRANPGEVFSIALDGSRRSLSRSPALDSGAVPSPNADLVAFWSARSGADRLYLVNGDGTNLRIVKGVHGSPDGRSGEDALAFSADGTRLVTTSHRKNETEPDHFLVDPRTGSATHLPWCTGEAVPSPHGAELACQGLAGQTPVRLEVHGYDGTLRFSEPGAVGIWSSLGDLAVASHQPGFSRKTGTTTIVDSAGHTLARVPGDPAAWTPDGRRLLLWRAGVLYTTLPGSLTATHRIGTRDPFTLTPDSQGITTTVGGASVEIPFAGGPLRPAAGGGDGVWSRTGRLAWIDIAHEGHDRKAALIVTDTHGEHPATILRMQTTSPDGNISIQWLADGAHVLVTSSSECDAADLYAAPASGGAARRLTRGPRSYEEPAGSADGTRIAYAVSALPCNGELPPKHIETVAAVGGSPMRVADDDHDVYPAFTPDDATIVFIHALNDGTAALESAPAAGGPHTVLAAFAADGSTTATLPTGGFRFAYITPQAVMGLPSAGGAPVVLAPAPPGGPGCRQISRVAWSLDGQRLAVARSDGIYTIALGAGATWTRTIRTPCPADPAFSPDGREIAFDAPRPGRERHETDVLVANSDGSDLRVVSAAPFRQSRDPGWLVPSTG